MRRSPLTRNATLSALLAVLLAVAPAAAQEVVPPAGGSVGFASGDWTPATPMSLPLMLSAVVQCPEEPESAYFIGGTDSTSLIPTARVLRFNAASGTWSDLAPFPVPTLAAAATCFRGMIYANGALGDVNGFYRYNIATNTWTKRADLPRDVLMAAMGAWNGKVYVVGGDNDPFAGGTSDEVDVYDIAGDSWTIGADMPVTTSLAGVVQQGPFLYLAGGAGLAAPAAYVSVTQRYDMSRNVWELGPAFASARVGAAMISMAGRLWAVGGQQVGIGAIVTLVEYLDLAGWPDGSWREADVSLPVGLVAAGGFATSFRTGGELWLAGGLNGPSVVDTVQYLRDGRSALAVANASFEAGGRIPSRWTAVGLATTDGRTTSSRRFGAASQRLGGSLVKDKILRQGIRVSGAAGDTFHFSGWSRAAGVSPRGGSYKITVKFFNSDGTESSSSLNFGRGTHAWQLRQARVTAPKNYDSARVFVQLGKVAGTAWFDGVQFWRY